MAAWLGSDTADGRAASQTFENVACPFCGLLCDDLEVSREGDILKVRKNGCEKAIAGFERAPVSGKPSMDGRTVDLAEAIGAAAGLVRRARLPLFGGLATDADGMRAAMSLAERAGGVLDHALSEAQHRNLSVLQTSGWITSTLTETRNRADLIIIAGGDVHKAHPRFFERIVSAPDSMFGETPSKRTVVFLGAGFDASVAQGTRIGDVVTLPCAMDQIREVVSVLKARLRGAPVAPAEVAGLGLAQIDALADLCRKASYGVIVWAPPSLDFPHADLTVQQITELIKDLNKTGRFAGLSLGGDEGATTAGAVCAWQSGYPLRVSYAHGRPDYDAYRYSIGRMLAAGEGDALVWVASFTPGLAPPATNVPTVVLGAPGLKLAEQPAVFIPVGAPGMDHAGRLIRCDGVVSLPLRDLGRSPFPRVADVLAAVEAAL